VKTVLSKGYSSRDTYRRRMTGRKWQIHTSSDSPKTLGIKWIFRAFHRVEQQSQDQTPHEDAQKARPQTSCNRL